MNHWATLPVGCHVLCPMGLTGEVGPGKAWSKPEPPDRACPKHPTGILQPPPLSPPGKTLIILHLLKISHSSRSSSISPAPKPPVGPRLPPSRAFCGIWSPYRSGGRGAEEQMSPCLLPVQGECESPAHRDHDFVSPLCLVALLYAPHITCLQLSVYRPKALGTLPPKHTFRMSPFSETHEC